MPHENVSRIYPSLGPEMIGTTGNAMAVRLKAWGEKLEVSRCACAWSDLLNFSGPLKAANWKPGTEGWKSIGHRLRRAYDIHLADPVEPDDFMLVLNDGVVRTKTWRESETFCGSLGIWVRNIVNAHFELNRAEEANSLAGTRTVLAGGERANYGIADVHLEDLVINSTREGQGPSGLARRAGNPVLFSNPAPLQMNTAFSKAYILDSAGKAIRLRGRGFYVDRSFFELVAEAVAASPELYEYVERPDDGGILRGVIFRKGPACHPWCMAFLSAPEDISVVSDEVPFTTTVYRIRRFYPYNKDPRGVSFDLDHAFLRPNG